MNLFPVCNGALTIVLDNVTSVSRVGPGFGPGGEHYGYYIYSGQGKVEVSEYYSEMSETQIQEEHKRLLVALRTTVRT